MKLLFAGGCHLTGYPVGPEHAFPLLAADELSAGGILCEMRRVTHVPLHHPERVAQSCQEFQPDVLILQVGNFELRSELSLYLFSRLRANRKRSESSPAGGGGPYRLRARVKQGIDLLLRHPLVDLPSFHARLDGFAAAVAHCGVRRVIALSPTPCADFTAMHYRKAGGRLMRDTAARFGWTYVDLLGLVSGRRERRLGREEFFADSAHLGIAGQAAVAALVARSLREVADGCEVAHCSVAPCA